MRRLGCAVLFAAGLLAAAPSWAAERTPAQIVAGRFVVSPANTAVVWYVHPKLGTREVVATWEDLLRVADRSGATLATADLARIPDGQAPRAANAKLIRRLTGRILLDVSSGEVWYLSPQDGRRYVLRTPAQALTVLRTTRLGITAANLEKIPLAADPPSREHLALRRRLRGRVLWSVADGTFWYVSPTTLTRFPLAAADDAQTLLRTLYLGVSPNSLAAIPAATDAVRPSRRAARTYSGQLVRSTLDPALLWYVSPARRQRSPVTAATAASRIAAEQVSITPKGLAAIAMVGEAEYEERTVTTDDGTFSVQVLSSDLSLPGLALLTLGGNSDTCIDDCTTASVGAYAAGVSGITAVNGGYFCPAADADCAGKTDSYFGPLFHSTSRVLINGDLLPTSPYPMLVWDTANRPHYLAPAAAFVSVEDFAARMGVTVLAAIANWPALVEAGANVIGSQVLDAGQRVTKATRVALAVRGRTVLFVVVQRATVIDLAGVVAALGVDYAINLDGGSSTALWRYGTYLRGPGRTVPNAVVIARLPVE